MANIENEIGKICFEYCGENWTLARDEIMKIVVPETVSLELRGALERLKNTVVDIILPNAKNVTLDIIQEIEWNDTLKDVDEALKEKP